MVKFVMLYRITVTSWLYITISIIYMCVQVKTLKAVHLYYICFKKIKKALMPYVPYKDPDQSVCTL